MGEKEIRSQLATFFEGQNIQDAKAKAKEVSDRIVVIYDDASLTITEKAQKVREVVENAAGKVNKQKLDQALKNTKHSRKVGILLMVYWSKKAKATTSKKQSF